MRRFEASPYRATPKGHKSFIFRTASLLEAVLLPTPSRVQDATPGKTRCEAHRPHSVTPGEVDAGPLPLRAYSAPSAASLDGSVSRVRDVPGAAAMASWIAAKARATSSSRYTPASSALVGRCLPRWTRLRPLPAATSPQRTMRSLAPSAGAALAEPCDRGNALSPAVAVPGTTRCRRGWFGFTQVPTGRLHRWHAT